MQRFCRTIVLLSWFTTALAVVPPHVAQAETPADVETIFDGKTLTGWDGNPDFWRVEDGAITGETTADNPTKGNTFIIWRGGHVDNFELTCDYRIVGHNSGIQYRSFEVPDNKWVVGGYQADFEAGDTYSGILYGEKFRGILALRGEKSELTADNNGKMQKTVLETIGDSAEIQSKIRKEDWNSYRIVANGFHLTHYINNVKTCECIDNDVQHRRAVGIVALQLHAGPPMKVQFRNIRLKRLPATKKVALIAGTKSHGYGAHEHNAGCILLANALRDSGLPIEPTVYTGGWPDDASVLDDADAILIYCDGGGRHPFNSHISELNRIAQKGIGISCIHYGVEVPKGESGNAFLDWTGGYFEADWSVNPHWTADFKTFPNHPITRGVRRIQIHDEWYYHMRFREQMDGITPILTTLPPSDTLVRADGSLSRPDGPHSNNAEVRAAVLERKEPQHTAWARERLDAGRGFGFTGGHDHWNWGNDNFRKLVLNAIAWTAHADIPANGIESTSLTVKRMMENQDYPVPDNFNPARIQKMLDEWNAARVTN